MLRAEEDVRMWSVEEEGQEDIGDLVRMWGQNVRHKNEWRYWGLSSGRAEENEWRYWGLSVGCVEDIWDKDWTDTVCTLARSLSVLI